MKNQERDGKEGCFTLRHMLQFFIVSTADVIPLRVKQWDYWDWHKARLPMDGIKTRAPR